MLACSVKLAKSRWFINSVAMKILLLFNSSDYSYAVDSKITVGGGVIDTSLCTGAGLCLRVE